MRYLLYMMFFSAVSMGFCQTSLVVGKVVLPLKLEKYADLGDTLYVFDTTNIDDKITVGIEKYTVDIVDIKGNDGQMIIDNISFSPSIIIRYKSSGIEWLKKLEKEWIKLIKNNVEHSCTYLDVTTVTRDGQRKNIRLFNSEFDEFNNYLDKIDNDVIFVYLSTWYFRKNHSLHDSDRMNSVHDYLLVQFE